MAPEAPRKTNWGDIGDLRRPNGAWRLGHAARWFERRLGLARGSVVFQNPDGTRARSDKKLTSLRADWKGR